ncbi:transcription termination/antitermination NusG family protein [Endozoicomonas lisbonensis]|uniref:Transcription antitermination factor NusG n=1 Tax=Endozoicomonas lisbonensis TaxID=3120522 RepID=A0ABV2SI79_9GAMM
MSNRECLLEEGWYLLKSKVRQELRATENLNNLGFDTYCPVFRQKSKGTVKEEILFPGYLFLLLDLEKDLGKFHTIRSCRGVHEMVHFNRITRHLVSSGRMSKKEEEKAKSDLLPKPIPNGDEIIDEIRKIVKVLNNKADGIKPDALEPGDKVVMNHPLFKHLEMTFEKNLGSFRGEILISHIQEQRLSDGSTQKTVVKKQRMKVRLDDLEKA